MAWQWYGPHEQPEGRPDDLLSIEEVVSRLESVFGIITIAPIFNHLTQLNWGPANWIIDGKRCWSRSQLDFWVLGWKVRPAMIDLKFREPRRIPGFDPWLRPPSRHWIGTGPIEFLFPKA